MWADRQSGASTVNGHGLGLGSKRELMGVSELWEGVNGRSRLRTVQSRP